MISPASCREYLSGRTYPGTFDTTECLTPVRQLVPGYPIDTSVPTYRGTTNDPRDGHLESTSESNSRSCFDIIPILPRFDNNRDTTTNVILGLPAIPTQDKVVSKSTVHSTTSSSFDDYITTNLAGDSKNTKGVEYPTLRKTRSRTNNSRHTSPVRKNISPVGTRTHSHR